MTRLRPLTLALCLALCAATHAEDAKPSEQPPLTEQTLRSGGQMPAEQQRVNFDHAELHFTVDIAQHSIQQRLEASKKMPRSYDLEAGEAAKTVVTIRKVKPSKKPR